MRERERAGGEFNHRLPNGDGPRKVCVCVCVCVWEEEIEKESVQYSVSVGRHPCSVCLSLFVRQNKWEEMQGERKWKEVTGMLCWGVCVCVCVCVCVSTLHQHLHISNLSVFISWKLWSLSDTLVFVQARWQAGSSLISSLERTSNSVYP